MNDNNWKWIDSGRELEQGPLVGCTAWGLSIFVMNPWVVEELVRMGVLDYRDVETMGVSPSSHTNVWLCEECAEGLEAEQKVWSSQHGGQVKAVRTTSDQAAKGLCFACRASAKGIPELMQTVQDNDDLEPWKVYYWKEAVNWSFWKDEPAPW